MIPIHNPETKQLLGYYEPETGVVRDAMSHHLFTYKVKSDMIEIRRKGKDTKMPLKLIRDIVGAVK